MFFKDRWPTHSWPARVRFWLGENTPIKYNLQAKWMNRFEVPLTRVSIAIHCAWLALSGDQTLFNRYETRHTDGFQRLKKSIANEKELKKLREALNDAPNPSLIEELGILRQKTTRQKAEIRTMQECLEFKNRELDALNFVWCTGACESGQNRYGKPTNELTRNDVMELITQANRFATRWDNNCPDDEMINYRMVKSK